MSTAISAMPSRTMPSYGSPTSFSAPWIGLHLGTTNATGEIVDGRTNSFKLGAHALYPGSPHNGPAGAGMHPMMLLHKEPMMLDGSAYYHSISPGILFGSEGPSFKHHDIHMSGVKAEVFDSSESEHDHQRIFQPDTNASAGDALSDSPTLSSGLSDEEAANSASSDSLEQLGFDELLDFGDGMEGHPAIDFKIEEDIGEDDLTLSEHYHGDAQHGHQHQQKQHHHSQEFTFEGVPHTHVATPAFYPTIPAGLHMVLAANPSMPFPTPFGAHFLTNPFSTDHSMTTSILPSHYAYAPTGHMTPPALPKKITKATAAIGSTTKGNSDNTDSGTGLLTCPHPGCGKVFTKPFAIRAHVKSHGAERTYRCELCESSFRRSHDLKRHFRSIHTVIKPFGCETCGKRFSRMDALKRHVKRQGTPCYVCTQ